MRASLLSTGICFVVGTALILACTSEPVAQRAGPIPNPQDLHALVRPAIRADTSIQALRPPAVAYVWFQARTDGEIVASGRDTSRVSLLRHAAALGRVKVQGFAPAGVLATAKVVYAWVELPAQPSPY
jgi:hypothetical protein